MNFDQIEVVLAIAETLSFAECADIVSLSASTVSRMLNSLENELGVRLFFRNAKAKVYLTEEGKILLPYFQAIQQMHRQMLDRVERLQSEAGTFRFICPAHLADLESELLLEFMGLHPSVNVTEFRITDKDAISYLYNGKADVGIVTLLGGLEQNPLFIGCSRDPNFMSYPILMEQGQVVLNRRHPLSSRQSLTLKDLAECEEKDLMIVSFSEDIARHQVSVLKRWAASQDLVLDARVLNVRTNLAGEMINSYIQRHPEAITIVRDILIRNDDVVKIPLKEPELYFTTLMYYLESNNSPLLKDFIRCVKQRGKEHNKLRMEERNEQQT